MVKTHDSHVKGYEFETHKVKKSSIIYIEIWKCVGWLDPTHDLKKKN